MKRWTSFILIGLGLTISGFSQQQTPSVERLVNLLPPDLMAVAATSGWDKLKADFENTDAAKAWNEPSVQAFYHQIRDAILGRIRTSMDEKGKDGQKFNLALSLLRSIYNQPTVMGVTDRTGAEGVDIHGFLILDAGDRKSQIADILTRLEALAEKGKIEDLTIHGVKMWAMKQADHPPVMWGWVDKYLVLVVNDETGAIVKHLKTPQLAFGLPIAPPYLQAVENLAKMGEGKFMYIDLPKVGRAVRAKIAAKESPATTRPAGPMLTQVVNQLGLSNLQTLVMRSGFTGPDWRVESRVALPATARKGIFPLLHRIDMSILSQVPAQVIEAQISNVDWLGMYDLVLATIKAASPTDYNDALRKIQDFESTAKVNVRMDLLNNLAGPAVRYGVPTAGQVGSPFGGRVMLMRLKSGTNFERAMAGLEKYLESKSEGKFQATDQKVEGRTYHFWMIPQLAMLQVAPVWTVSGDTFVIGSTMPQVSAAIRQATTQNAQGTSLRGNPDFQAATKNTPDNLIGFKYVDHKRKSEQVMQTLQQFWPMAVMLAQQKHGVQLPMMLPPAADISKHLSSEVAYTWYASDGLGCHDQGSLVNSDVWLSIVAVALPAIIHGREHNHLATSQPATKE